jgi:16S rRNA (guanine527-N7)-methyltransferase
VPTFDLSALQLWLRPFGVELSAEERSRTQVFLDTLVLWNRRFNLVSQSRTDEIITKHLADSFVVASLIGVEERIVDLGSGGGFPGIPIAIARTSPVSLVEGNQKKASFLSEAAARCRLSHVTIVNDRIETVCERAEFVRSYSVVTARALWKVSDLLSASRALLAPGGRLLAMKGPGYQQELSSQDAQRFDLAGVFAYELPDGSKRNVLDLRFT